MDLNQGCSCKHLNGKDDFIYIRKIHLSPKRLSDRYSLHSIHEKQYFAGFDNCFAGPQWSCVCLRSQPQRSMHWFREWIEGTKCDWTISWHNGILSRLFVRDITTKTINVTDSTYYVKCTRLVHSTAGFCDRSLSDLALYTLPQSIFIGKTQISVWRNGSSPFR